MRIILIIMLMLFPLMCYADETYTVKPDGGGNYTTLQAGETAQQGDLTGRGIVTFECYDGTADLGECTVDGWTNQDASNYVRIFVPLAERHDGTLASAGAWIDVDGATNGIRILEDYTRVEGIRFNMDDAVWSAIGIDLASVSNVIIDSNLFVGVSETAGTETISVDAINTDVSGIIVRNNILYGDGTAYAGIVLSVLADSANVTVSATIQNNTVDDFATYGYGIEEQERFVFTSTINVTLENNIGTNNGTDFYNEDTDGTITGNNNCSEDATADDWDGSGSIINQTPGNLFVTEGSDHNLKSGVSNAIDAGKTIGAFDWDALHLDADNWRPQEDAWDMGALEGGIAPVPAGQVIFL